MGKAKERGIAGLLSEFRPRRNNFFPAAMPLSFYLPGSLLLTHMPQPFRAVYRQSDISPLNRQSASIVCLLFSEWMPFCFSGCIIFFFRKQLQWLYACMVMFSPQNPQVCSSVAAFHFIVQSLFSIRGILYASFFGFIFLKGIAEVSSGVSIGGRPYFRNVPCFLSDRLFFCILSKPVADFQVLSFSYHFLVKSNHFPLQIQIVANPGYGDKGAIHKHHVVIRLKSSFFCPAQKAYLTRIICCHLHQ